MPRPVRPALVTVVSVFNIILGIITPMCVGGCGAMFVWVFSMLRSVPARPGEPNMKEMVDIFAKHYPRYEEIMIGSCVLIGALGLLFIICGIGTLMLKQWARILTIVAALVLILHGLALSGYYFAIVIPNTPKMEKDLLEWQAKLQEQQRKQIARQGGTPPPPPAFAPNSANQAGNHVFYLGLLLAYVLYGAGNILVMLLPGTRAAFAAAPESDDEPRESFSERRRRLLDDDDFDRPQRRYDDDDER